MFREKEVRRGIALLDTMVPDWKSRISLETLNMAYSKECILGQVFEDYNTGLLALNLLGDEPLQYGFAIYAPAQSHTSEVYASLFAEYERLNAKLTETWRKELTNYGESV